MFKIKDGYKLEFQTPETMKLFGGNQYQQKSEVFHTFTPNKSYAYLLNVEPNNLVFLKTYNVEFDEIITFTDKSSRTLEIKRQRYFDITY